MEKADPTPRTPGAVLRDIRILLAPLGEKALTQAQLGKQLRYSEQYIQRIETGHAPMLFHHVREIAKLDVEPERADAF